MSTHEERLQSENASLDKRRREHYKSAQFYKTEMSRLSKRVGNMRKAYRKERESMIKQIQKIRDKFDEEYYKVLNESFPGGNP